MCGPIYVICRDVGSVLASRPRLPARAAEFLPESMFAQQPTAQGEQATLQGTKQGVLIVESLHPDELNERMEAMESFRRLSRSAEDRCCYIRIRLRLASLDEEQSAWIQDRDFAIALLSLQGPSI